MKTTMAPRIATTLRSFGVLLLAALAGTVQAGGNIPDPYQFNDQNNVPLQIFAVSNAVTITGLSGSVNVEVRTNCSGGAGTACTGGAQQCGLSIGCNGTFSGTGSISNGQTVCVRHRTPNTTSTVTNTALIFGGQPGGCDTFSTTTAATVDTTPNAFSFTDATNVPRASVITSPPVQITGITAPTPVSVSGGVVSIGCTGTFTATPGNINNGEPICARHTSAAGFSATTDTVVTIGGVSDTFTSTTIPPDTQPDTFTFTDQSGVATSTTITSNAVTITGIDVAVSIQVSGGPGSAYSIGCGASFTNAAGTIANGQTVCVRHTSAAAASTAQNTVLNVGGVTDTFTSVTAGAADVTPDAFSFVDQTGVPRNTTITSAPVTITGIDAAAPISVGGAGNPQYSIGCGATFTSAAGTITNGQTVCIRHTSSPAFATAVNSALSVGGVSDTFTSTTAPADTTPDAFAFVDQNNVAPATLVTSNAVAIAGIDAPAAVAVSGDGEYAIGCAGAFTTAAGTITNGQTVCVRHTSAPAGGTRATTLTVGGVSDTFTTVSGGTTPDPFMFMDQNNVPRSTTITSNTIAITGHSAPAPISVTGGTYSIGCGSTFTATAGTLPPGSSVCVRHTSAAGPSTATNTILTIGGVSDTFTSMTAPADTTPDAFTFTDQSDVPVSTVRTSNAVTITGIEQATPIMVAGGGTSEYSIGCTASFTSAAGMINNNETVCVRHTSAATQSTAVSTDLNVGGVIDTFTSVTAGTADTTPDAFVFTDATNVPLATLVTSAPVTITGITGPAAISISGAAGSQYSIGCGAGYTAASGTINNGQTVCVRHTSAGTPSSTVSTVLTVGGVSDTYTSTTVPPDSTPDAFTFTDVTDTPSSTPIASAPVTITGINTPAAVSVSGSATSEYSIGCGAAFTNAAGMINNNTTICVRHTTPGANGASRDTILTVGGVSDTFTTQNGSGGGDSTPDPFNFADQTDVPTSVQIVSSPVTISGITNTVSVTINGNACGGGGGCGPTNCGFSVGCTGTYTSSSGTITNGQTLCVRHNSSAAFGTTVNTGVTIGGVCDTFSSTTAATADTTPNPFTFTDQTDVPRTATITSNAVAISGITAPAPISVTGGVYSIGCGAAFTGAAGTITNGQTVCVRHISSAQFATATDTVLTIGGVTDTFTSTTIATDIEPDPFQFTDLVGVATNATQTSNTVTITGISGSAPISVTGGTYSIGCGAAFTGTAGTIANNQTVCVRHTSSASPSTRVDTTLTVGGVSDTFSSTTIGSGDTTPNAFTFTDQANVALSTVVVSNAVTITGIDSPAPIVVTGAPSSQYSIGCTPNTFTTAPGTVTNNQTVCVRHISAATPSTATATTLQVGGGATPVADTFTSTTTAADQNPDPFMFTDQTNVALSTLVTSAAVTITGIDAATPIAVGGAAGSEYSIGCVAANYTSTSGTIANGQTVCVRHTSSGSFSTATGTVLTVGGVSDTFTSTTVAADTTPNAFAFTDQTGVPLSSTVTSGSITVAGIDAPAAISVSGAAGSEYSIGCGTYTSVAGTVTSGDTVCVRHTSAATNSTVVNTTLTIGGVSDTFTSTTVAVSNTPPSVTYAPTFDTTVELAAGAATITATSAANGSGSGTAATTTVSSCAIGGAGAAAFAPVTLTPSPIAFVGATSGSGSIGLTCARSGVAADATLTCNETAGAGAPVVRSWPVRCPALPTVPPVTFGQTLTITCTGNIVGTTNQTLVVTHNDADENPASYPVRCNVRQSPQAAAIINSIFATDQFNDVLFGNGFE